MPDTQTPTTELTSHYTAQVAGDLEHNAKEQERISVEIDALQEQLRALQHDRTVLTHMQKALGISDTATRPTPEETAAPSVPRQKTDITPGAGKRASAKKTPLFRTARLPRRRPPRSPHPRPRRRPRKLPGPPSSNSSAATSPIRANPAPRRKSPPRSTRPIPTAPSRPPSYAPHSKTSSPKAASNAPSRAPPSTTPPPTPRNRPLPRRPQPTPSPRQTDQRDIPRPLAIRLNSPVSSACTPPFKLLGCVADVQFGSPATA